MELTSLRSEDPRTQILGSNLGLDETLADRTFLAWYKYQGQHRNNYVRTPHRRKRKSLVTSNKGAADPSGSAAKDTSTWLTRHETSDTLTISEQTLANYERRGILHPRYDYRRDRHGIDRRVVVYDPSEIQKVRAFRPYHRDPDPVAKRTAGEVDARACELFREGKSDEQVVVELRETFDRVDELRQKWTDRGGGRCVIAPEAWRALEGLVGPFADVTELVEKLMNRLELQPTVTKSLDGEQAPRASGPPARKWVAEVLSTGTSSSDGEAAAGAALGRSVELPGAGVCTNAASGPDSSLTKASVNEQSAPAPTRCQSVGGPVSEAGTVDGRAAKSSPEGAVSGAVAETSGTASGIRVVRSSREQQLDAWLESLNTDDARLLRLSALLKREELEMFAELERGIRTDSAATMGSDSLRERLLDRLLVSLAEDEARLDKIGVILTATELDMLAKLGRGLAELEATAATNGDASPE